MKIGVIVGRFQVDQLTEGHKRLISHAFSNSDKLLIFIGSVNKPPSHNNPLPYEARTRIIETYIKNCGIFPLHDNPSNDEWSRTLDGIVYGLYPNDKITLFGGRDSGCLKYYSGKMSKAVFEDNLNGVSATLRRKQVATITSQCKHNVDPGTIIWTTQSQYPKVYPTVDCIIRDRGGFIILIRKKGQSLWRFPGGFADPFDLSFEMSCRREMAEECGIEITDPIYVGSIHVNDWRYRGEQDKIITTLFTADQMFGRLKAGDDAQDVLGFNDGNVAPHLVEEHKPLWEMYQKWLQKPHVSARPIQSQALRNDV